MRGKKAQNLEFFLGEKDWCISGEYHLPGHVNAYFPGRNTVRFRLFHGRTASEHSLYTGQHFMNGKRFADIVVSPGRETCQKVILGILCSKENDRYPAFPLLPDDFRHSESGHSFHHYVKEYKAVFR